MVGMLFFLSCSFFFVSLYFFQGCGKSVVAREFAEMLGYGIEPVMLYQVNPNITYAFFTYQLYMSKNVWQRLKVIIEWHGW